MRSERDRSCFVSGLLHRRLRLLMATLLQPDRRDGQALTVEEAQYEAG